MSGNMAITTQNLLQQRFDAPLPDYQQRRVIFWYDKNHAYQQEVADYQLDNVVILTVTTNNYFAVKYQIEVKKPHQNFLLYLPMTQPEPQKDPLYDIYLYSQPEFHIDRLSQVLDELHVSDQEVYRGTLLVYKKFFENKQRQKKLVSLMKNETDLTPEKLKLGIFLTLVGGERLAFTNGLVYLLAEWAQGKTTLWQKVQRFGSSAWFWQQAKIYFGYHATNLTLTSLVSAIFATKTAVEFNNKVPKNWQNLLLSPENNAVVFIDQWQNACDLSGLYQVVANKASEILRIPAFVRRKSVNFLVQGTTFEIYDKTLVSLVAEQLATGSILYDDYELQLINRRTSLWYSKFKADYRVLIQAIYLFRSLSTLQINAETKTQLWQQYQNDFSQIDRTYRQFQQSYEQIYEPGNNFQKLQQKVEHFYINDYLQPLAQLWDSLIGEQLPLTKSLSTIDFYQKKIAGLVADKRRVFIIVVDALRYEIAGQLQDILNRNQHFDTYLEPMETTVPSYTDLGMAALLPHRQLTLNDKGQVEVDGQLSAGLQNRERILNKQLPTKNVTVRSGKVILSANRDQLRQLYKGTNVNYIYLDTIDARGDNAKSEDEVFTAVDLALKQLQEIIGLLTGHVSATNIFVTADHGFLYTHQPLTTLDKLQQPKGIVSKRRFVINKDLRPAINTHVFKLTSLKTQSLAAHIPAALLRYAVQGGGSKYIHGGTTLQEIMVPLLTIRTERGAHSPQQVEVALLTDLTTLGSYTLNVSFIQIQSVSNLRRSKRILVYLEDSKQNVISNQLAIIADYHNDSVQQRILTGKLIVASDVTPRYQQGTLVVMNAADPDDVQWHQINLDLPELN